MTEKESPVAPDTSKWCIVCKRRGYASAACAAAQARKDTER